MNLLLKKTYRLSCAAGSRALQGSRRWGLCCACYEHRRARLTADAISDSQVATLGRESCRPSLSTVQNRAATTLVNGAPIERPTAEANRARDALMSTSHRKYDSLWEVVSRGSFIPLIANSSAGPRFDPWSGSQGTRSTGSLAGVIFAGLLFVSISEHYWRHDSAIDRKAEDVRATIVT